MTSKNTLPTLINAVRPTLPTVANWAGRSLWVARLWQQGTHPQPKDRARLLKAIRAHANELLALADAVEREGKAQHGGK